MVGCDNSPWVLDRDHHPPGYQKNKMKRQGLITTIEELRMLADELEAQVELNKLQIIKDCGYNTKFQLNIINKSGLSDEWEFEKTPSKKTKWKYL